MQEREKKRYTHRCRGTIKRERERDIQIQSRHRVHRYLDETRREERKERARGREGKRERGKEREREERGHKKVSNEREREKKMQSHGGIQRERVKVIRQVKKSG